MVEVTYHCPYCGALTSLERDAYLDDRTVTREPLDGWEYAATTADYEAADGVELVCLGNVEAPANPDEGGEDAETPASPDDPGMNAPDPTGDGCGRTYYLSFVKFEDGSEREPPGTSLEDGPSFDFLR